MQKKCPLLEINFFSFAVLFLLCKMNFYNFQLSPTETSLHEPLTDNKIVRAPLGTCTSCEHTVRSTVGSTVRNLEVLTESPDTYFWCILQCQLH